jgi:amidase
MTWKWLGGTSISVAGTVACLLIFLGGASRSPEAMDSDLIEVSIPKLESYYASGKYTAVQVTRWHLARIAKYNPEYNAFIKLFPEQALARAAQLDAEATAHKPKGALWGVPVVVKASISIAGEVTSVGWWGYTRPGLELRARANSTVVNKLLDAGAIILGQTNLPDLAASDTTASSVAGRTGNAYAADFSPGGSSGGSATAVAANFALVALGTDGGNSIRNPASNLSLVGVLPTKGLISIAGVHAGGWLRERTGPLTRTVTDAAIMLDVLSGVDGKDSTTAESAGHRPTTFTSYLRSGALKGKRLGVPKFVLDGTPSKPNPNYWNRGTSPATRAAFMKTVEELRAAGATVVFADDILPESFSEVVAKIHDGRYLRQGVNAFLAQYGPPAYRSTEEFEAVVGVNYPPDGMGGPDTGHILEEDPEAEGKYFEPLRQALQIFRETMKRYDLDAFVYPPLQVPPTFEGRPLPSDFPSDGPYSATGWLNKLGIPAVVVPAGFYGSGLPYGLEIAGDKWSEGNLLSYAYDFEQRTQHRKPPQLQTRTGATD